MSEAIEAYLWATPNSNRVSILLEELGLDYRVRGVNIRAREQFAPEILALNPYGKIPIVTIATGDYSIADIAAFPWIARPHWGLIEMKRFPNLARWHDEIATRPAVRRGMDRPEGVRLG